MNTTTTIHIVIGTCGEFVNSRKWNVKAFPSRELAESYAQECELALVNEFDIVLRSPGYVHPLDPYFEYDPSGTGYYTESLELAGALEAEKCPDCGQRYDEPNGLNYNCTTCCFDGKMNDL